MSSILEILNLDELYKRKEHLLKQLEKVENEINKRIMEEKAIEDENNKKIPLKIKVLHKTDINNEIKRYINDEVNIKEMKEFSIQKIDNRTIRIKIKKN